LGWSFVLWTIGDSEKEGCAYAIHVRKKKKKGGKDDTKPNRGREQCEERKKKSLK